MVAGLFGSSLRTKALIAIGNLGETYPAELARLLKTQPFAVQKVIASLESTGAVVSRTRGRTRLVTLNPRWFAYAELYGLLLKLGQQPEISAIVGARRRPRAIGKPL